MVAKQTPNTWIRIPRQTYIQPVGDTTKYFVKGTEGIPFNKKYFMPDSGVLHYAVIFSAIQKTTGSIRADSVLKQVSYRFNKEHSAFINKVVQKQMSDLYFTKLDSAFGISKNDWIADIINT